MKQKDRIFGVYVDSTYYRQPLSFDFVIFDQPKYVLIPKIFTW